MKLAQIALRNLTRQKRRSLLLAGAIAVGILIVTLVNGFSAGTVRVLKENMADLIGGHVFITVQHRENNKTTSLITDDSKLIAALHKLGVADADIAKTVDVEGNMLFSGKESPQIMVGVDWVASSAIRNKLAISQGEFDKAISYPNGVIISKKTADKLKVSLGDSVLLKCKTVSGQQNVGDFVVGYITGDTSEFGGMVAFANKDVINKLANLPSKDAYLNLRIHLASVDVAPAFALLLEAELAKDFKVAPKSANMMNMMDDNVMRMNESTGFSGERVQVTTVNDMLSAVTSMSEGLAFASLIMLVVLLGITMLGIANTFRMILYERIQEIGTMRAVGMQSGEVRRLFLYEAVFLSLLGVVLGVVLAAISMVLLGLVNFGTDSMISILLNNGHLSFMLDAGSMLICTILVVIFTILAALGPAGKAAKLAPAEALRTSY